MAEFGKNREEKRAGLVKHLSYVLERKRICLVQPAICCIHVALNS